MNILFYLGHPAHFYIFRNVINELISCEYNVQITIKSKDILEDLVKNEGYDYINISPKARKFKHFAIMASLLKREIALSKIVAKFKPFLLVGTETTLAHIGKIFNIPTLIVQEDDAHVIPYFAYLTYPFATHILSPECCDVGKWCKKKISYSGYHELAYLHPNHFTPDPAIVKTFNPTGAKYFILRFAKLSAHHDFGKKGISGNIAKDIITLLKGYGKVFITSERELEPEFEEFRINIKPNDIHHALYFADLYIGDSQTMAAEAAVLGTPSIRFNDFVGEIGYLEELQHKYGLTYGIKTSEPQKIFSLIKELLKNPNTKDQWRERSKKMISEKIDLSAFLGWLIKNYPDSILRVKENPQYMVRFRG